MLFVGGDYDIMGPGTIYLPTSDSITVAGQTTATIGASVSGGGSMAILGGATFDLAGNSLTLGAVAVNGGSVIDSSGGYGSLTSSGFTLDNATISATLYDFSGTDTLNGTVVMNDVNQNTFLNNVVITSNSSV